MNPSEYLFEAVKTQYMRDAAEIEKVIEAALVTGTMGVLVIRGQFGNLIYAQPDSSVPYGVVHEKRWDPNDTSYRD